MQDLQYASKEKVVEDHSVIDDAIQDKAKVCTRPFRLLLASITDRICRATLCSLFRCPSSTGQTRPRCEICNRKTTSARPGWLPHQTAATLLPASPAQS